MPNWTKYAEEPKQIDILLFDQFSNHCLANALEPFRAANTLVGREFYRWLFYTLDGRPAVSSSGIPVIPNHALGPDQKGHFLFVMSSYGYHTLDTPATRAALRSAAKRSKVTAGLDTGSWLLAAAGQLDGKRATIHTDVLETFSEKFHNVQAEPERFIIDDDRITCSGAMAAFDLALYLIGEHHGEALRLDVAALFMHEPQIGTGPVSKQQPKSRLIARAVVLMQENLDNPLRVGQISDLVGCSQKDLERRFNAEFGAPPSRVYRHIRLTAVRQLIENSDLPILEVALRCGYENASAMTRAFVQKFGSTPRSLRKRT
jgi:transcriptional regulator GlxA family with amidase domain